MNLFRLTLAMITLSTMTTAGAEELITTACAPRGGNFGALPGEYMVQLKIGGREFEDKLTIASVTRRPGMASLSGAFYGKFEVPGVFESPVQAGTLMDRFYESMESDRYEMEFMIEANENGKKYPVYFYFEGYQPNNTIAGVQACFLTGKGYLKPRDKALSQEVLGEAILRKTSSPCICR